MPSVGMRRTTRIFGARVLRSGRRVWTGSGERKHHKTSSTSSVVDWIHVIEASGGGSHHKGDAWNQSDVPEKQEVTNMDIEEETEESKSIKQYLDGSILDSEGMSINVYTRKRKKKGDLKVCDEKTNNVDYKRFEKTYSRGLWSKRWTKKIRLCEITEDLQTTLKIVVPPSCSVRCSVSFLLDSVLRYLRKSRIGVNQLFAFFGSKMISNVYSSHGIHFVQVNLILFS